MNASSACVPSFARAGVHSPATAGESLPSDHDCELGPALLTCDKAGPSHVSFLFVLASAAAEAETGPVKDFVFFNRKSSPVIFNRNSSPVEAESASVSTIANVDNDALSSYDRRKAAVDTLPRQVHSNSPPTCAPTQQNASTHHGRTHHSPFPTCQPRSSVLCIARSAAAAVHSAPPPRVNHVRNKTGLRASQ